MKKARIQEKEQFLFSCFPYSRQKLLCLFIFVVKFF